MNVILNNISNASIKNIEINEVLSVSNFIEKICQYLEIDILEQNSYYTIIYNNNEKKRKAKLGYIYKDLNNEMIIKTTAEERYLQYYIENYHLNNLEIECRKNEGIPQNLCVFFKREDIRMGDDGPYEGQILLTPEISWSKIILKLPYYNLFKFIKVEYTSLSGNKEVFNIVENGKLTVEDICFSKFIKINNIDVTKSIIIKLSNRVGS